MHCLVHNMVSSLVCSVLAPLLGGGAYRSGLLSLLATGNSQSMLQLLSMHSDRSRCYI